MCYCNRSIHTSVIKAVGDVREFKVAMTLKFDLELGLLREQQCHEVQHTEVKIGLHVRFLLNDVQQASWYTSSSSSSSIIIIISINQYKKDGYRQRNVRQLLHILVSPGYAPEYAPGTIAVYVTWMERGYNAGQMHRSMYLSIFNRLRAIARYWLEIATFSYPHAFNAPAIHPAPAIRLRAELRHVFKCV